MDSLSWFRSLKDSKEYALLKERPIAYFCAEYAIRDDIPTYSGGLGVLAGDIIREASELDIPLITVGLFYHEGYLYHDIYREGIMMKISGKTNPATLDLKPVLNDQNQRVIVQIPILNETVSIQAWYLDFGSVRSYFLDKIGRAHV